MKYGHTIPTIILRYNTPFFQSILVLAYSEKLICPKIIYDLSLYHNQKLQNLNEQKLENSRRFTFFQRAFSCFNDILGGQVY